MQNRRMFLGSAAAAGVGAAVGVGLVFPAHDTHAQGHADTGDPLAIELQAQLAEAVRAMRSGKGRPGEHARRIASILRLANAHGIASSFDAGLPQLVQDEGRDKFLLRELNIERINAEAQALGIGPVPPLRSNFQDRARGLDALMTSGASGALEKIGGAFERLSGTLDRLTIQPVSRRQDACDEWWNVLVEIETYVWWACQSGFDGGLCFYMICLWSYCYAVLCALGCGC